MLTRGGGGYEFKARMSYQVRHTQNKTDPERWLRQKRTSHVSMRM